MIITRTPLRISLFGGGSDLPNFYRNHGGAVLCFAIDSYVYITIHDRFDLGYRIGYSKNEEVSSISDIQHPLVRNSLLKLGISDSLEITSIADVPSRGSGLGSSSAFTIGLLNALHHYKLEDKNSVDLASEACSVEIDLANEPIGKQDQFACSVGGINFIEFEKNDEVRISSIHISKDLESQFLAHSLLFYTGVTRSANPLLMEQSKNSVDNPLVIQNILKLKKLAQDSIISLYEGDFKKMGQDLNASWELKKTLNTGVSSDYFDSCYAAAIEAGAWGGKLLGAGGGGFFFFLAPINRRDAILKALGNLRYIPFGIDHEGTKVIYKSGESH